MVSHPHNPEHRDHGHHHGGQAASRSNALANALADSLPDSLPDSLAVKVLAAGAGLRILMVLPAIALLWAAVAWALLGGEG